MGTGQCTPAGTPTLPEHHFPDANLTFGEFDGDMMALRDEPQE
jgi:hypothetical protein